jgi:ABC-type multidrug transport system permease subunit
MDNEVKKAYRNRFLIIGTLFGGLVLSFLLNFIVDPYNTRGIFILMILISLPIGTALGFAGYILFIGNKQIEKYNKDDKNDNKKEME